MTGPRNPCAGSGVLLCPGDGALLCPGWSLAPTANSSRTREAPTPTIISMNSDAEAEKKGTPASP
ncbi:hypothetical protein AB0L75_32240, partial [Streptomyces sp. NPDC052101]|uniref:hypothetical protein n=1 Tax=Streptomyces sp. NPDC052101 TaxID=3155763 RepID=UPI00342727C0